MREEDHRGKIQFSVQCVKVILATLLTNVEINLDEVLFVKFRMFSFFFPLYHRKDSLKV